MIGLPAMVYPSGSKLSSPDRLPSWKIQTIAPKDAVIESRVMITAFSGSTTDPNSRNRMKPLASRVSPTAYGARCGLRDEEVVADRGAAADLGRDARRPARSRGSAG